MTAYSLAVDIGGTFTDAVLIDDRGHGWTDKTLTTHDDLLKGFFSATDLVLAQAGIGYTDINDVVTHATTVVTNVLIERKGAVTGLLTTQGFADVLYIRDEHRYDMFDPQIEYPEPLVTLDYTWQVNERILADGGVFQMIDENEIRDIGHQLLTQGVESIAICLLNSYANPVHEQLIKQIFAEVYPRLYVTLSSDIAPQMREYPRTSTACVNAYTAPVSKPYLDQLIEKMQDMGFKKEPLIMLSNGGVVGARTAGSQPVRMIESGPAAGALVAGIIAKTYGIKNLISFDMGGTTAKACLIQNGEPLVASTFEVDRRYRFKPGSGMPLIVPSVDMIEIGAGGGSIARVNDLGLLKVGPDSAGSNPGPACYGRGGQLACVTDADVYLGILDADNFLGGDMQLDAKATHDAIQHLAHRLHMSPEDAAFGIFSVVGESMAAAARAHATERGVSYRGLPLLAFGGAGPVHACYVAEQLESSEVIFPRMASVLSAFGTLVTPIRFDLARSILMRSAGLNWQKIDTLIDEMLEEGSDALQDAGLSKNAIEYSYSIDMRYVGQQTEVTVDLVEDPRLHQNEALLHSEFEAAYKSLYGLCLDDMDIEFVSWRVTAQSMAKDREVHAVMPKTQGEAKSTRQIYFGKEYFDATVFDRGGLAMGQIVNGPAIIEERETTIFILPNWKLKASFDGSLVATREED